MGLISRILKIFYKNEGRDIRVAIFSLRTNKVHLLKIQNAFGKKQWSGRLGERNVEELFISLSDPEHESIRIRDLSDKISDGAEVFPEKALKILKQDRGLREFFDAL